MKKVNMGMAGDSIEVEDGGVIIIRSGGRIDLNAGAGISLGGAPMMVADGATEDVEIAGTGTLSFVSGKFTGFTATGG